MRTYSAPIRIDAEQYERLRRAAEADRRSIASMLAVILDESPRTRPPAPQQAAQTGSTVPQRLSPSQPRPVPVAPLRRAPEPPAVEDVEIPFR